MSGAKHHTKNGFQNNHPIEQRGFVDILQWMWQRRGIKTKRVSIPLIKEDHNFLRENRSVSTLTWLGHSCFLFQYEGLNILTDPMLGDRASPVSFLGPKRVVPPAMTVKELPDIDWIILSHDHYDHLDRGTILQIREKQKENPPKYFVPLGVKKWFEQEGIHNVVELDWWESVREGSWILQAVPAQHFSGRKPFIQNDTLWAGWILKHPAFSYYFVGDTGYTPDFKEIGKQLGPFDLATIPIGAYDPRWFMSPVHVDPEGAVQIHKDIRSKFSVAMHWGTFVLTDEDMDEPVRLLKQNLQKQGIPEHEFIASRPGEVLRLPEKYSISEKKDDNSEKVAET